MKLSFIDIASFLVFFIIVVGVSMFKSRKEESGEDFFLAGRGLPRPIIGLSLIAANISTEQIVGQAGQGASNVGLAVFNYIQEFQDDQPAALAIGASNAFFQSKGRGVARIHGGGFAGTIQAYVHRNHFEDYLTLMKKLFGDNCVVPLKIRMSGVYAFVRRRSQLTRNLNKNYG